MESDSEREYLTSGHEGVDNKPTASVFEDAPLEYLAAEVTGSLKRTPAFAGKQPWMVPRQPEDPSSDDDVPQDEESDAVSAGDPYCADVLKYLRLCKVPLDLQVALLRSAASYLVASGKTSYKRPGPAKKRRVK